MPAEVLKIRCFKCINSLVRESRWIADFRVERGDFIAAAYLALKNINKNPTANAIKYTISIYKYTMLLDFWFGQDNLYPCLGCS